MDILLSKLEHYRFRGTSNLWFKNYLNGRKQFISIKGVDSSLREISCGVPQGSILGPIFFLILINDLPKASFFYNFLSLIEHCNFLQKAYMTYMIWQILSSLKLKIGLKQTN